MTHDNCPINVNYRTVEQDGVRRFFAVAKACRGRPASDQMKDVLVTLDNLCHKEVGGGAMVMQSVFLRNAADRAACQKAVEEFYGIERPATSYVAMPPCDGSTLAVEAWGVGSPEGKVVITRTEDGAVVAKHNRCRWTYLADVRANGANHSVHDQAMTAFRNVGERLAGTGLRMDDVVRTWLYLGDITLQECGVPRYHELNRARKRFYQDFRFGAGMIPHSVRGTTFPASTAVGMGEAGTAMGCIALGTVRPDVRLIPLENPRQTSACNYGQPYGLESPRFARAMAVLADEAAMVLISGTASIIGSDTCHAESVERQTQQSLDNIASLIATDNFQRHGLSQLGVTLGSLALARVYLKRPEDLPTVEAICRERLGNVPVLYLTSDMCRPELLLEIEGIAFGGICSWKGPS